MFTQKPVRNGASTRSEYHDDFVGIIQPFEDAGTRQPQRSGYMAELEEWLEEIVFEPIKGAIARQDSKELQIAFNEATAQIKRRVLASYHNGLKGQGHARQSTR